MLKPKPRRVSLAARGYRLAVRIRDFLGESWLRYVTAAGWAVLLVTVCCLVLVIAVDWIEAAVLALLGALVLLSGIVHVVGRTWYATRVELPRERAVVGDTAFGELQVRNTQQRAVRLGVVELPIADAEVQFVVPPLEAEQDWRETFAVPTRRRGVILIGPPRSVRSDPLGLFRRTQEWSKPVHLIVHPRTVRIPFDATGFQSDVEGVTTSKLSSSDVSFRALREYAPGDDRRNVHWPTTARTGTLTVRQFEETKRSHHLIMLDTAVSSWPEDTFETAVAATASLARAGLSQNRPVSLSTSTRWLSTVGVMQALDALAAIAQDSDSPELLPRVRQATTECPGASVLTLVVGPERSDAELGKLALLASIDTSVGVVRVRPDAPPARRTLGGTLVVDCPQLEDLPRLVRPRSGP